MFLSIGLLAEAKHSLLLADAVVGDSNISQDIVDGGSGNLSPADLTISNATELKTFISNIRNGDDYSGKTVVLGASFEVGTIEPIGYSSYELINNVVSQDFTYTRGFNGTFNGTGASNVSVTTHIKSYGATFN